MMDAMPMRLPSLPFLHRVCWLGTLCLLAVSSVVAQSTTSTQETFLAYRCEFDAATNESMIYASLVGVNGLALPRDSYEVSLSTPTMDEVPPQSIVVVEQTRRPPLEMIIVMDTTDTMPILDIVNAISLQLIPKLDVNDQVAFIAADTEITATTPFYIDKNRLINEHMLDLTPHTGPNNRVFDAVAQAISDLGAVESTRQVVLFITDSARRAEFEQASVSAIGTSAASNKTQIYTMGIHLWDDNGPDDSELLTIATASQGYAWIYDEATRSNAAAGTAIGERLNDLIETLNSEVILRVDMREQVPDAQNQVRFTINVKLENGVTLRDEIACPMALLKHSIAFEEGTKNNLVTSAPVNITVVPLSGLPTEQTSIVFRVNDEAVQKGDNRVFTFNTPTYQPGEYIISAELRDLNDNVLATTPGTVTINTQQHIDLIVEEGGSLPDFTPITLVSRANADTDLSEVRFQIRRRSDPSLVYPLGAGRAPFVNGIAKLSVPDVRAEVERLFPGINEGEMLEMLAIVPGLNDVVLAESDPLAFQYHPAPTGIVSGPQTNRVLTPTEAFFASISQEVIISTTASAVLVILNLIFFFRVGRARVRRMIYSPDTTEMSNRLMAVTVRRDNLKQTVSLTKRTVTLGRGSGNDVNLGDDTNVSREHAVIMWRRGRWYYTHRKPRLRTRIDGRRIVGYVLVELEAVTEMDMGETKLFFHSASQQDVSELTKTNL